MDPVRMVGFETLQSELENVVARGRTMLIAIDGRGGAGKSTLARKLAESLSRATVVEVDDFWLPGTLRPGREKVIAEPGSDYDWHRLRDQVIWPLSNDEPGRYQRYDWSSDSLREWHDVSAGGVVIIEGVFSTREELASFYDLRIWVETPEGVCLERGYVKDGKEGRELWDREWMPAYENYINTNSPMTRADYVIEGAG